jgi:hypothetical protein
MVLGVSREKISEAEMAMLAPWGWGSPSPGSRFMAVACPFQRYYRLEAACHGAHLAIEVIRSCP